MTTDTIPIRLARRYHVGWTVVLFLSIVVGALLAIPAYAYFYDYSWLDWTLFGVLYMVSGLGITVGYHRLMSHRSFDCPDWVKACLLIAGAWALQNSAIKWTADHLRHHAHTITRLHRPRKQRSVPHQMRVVGAGEGARNAAPQTIAPAGNSQPHSNQMPTASFTAAHTAGANGR